MTATAAALVRQPRAVVRVHGRGDCHQFCTPADRACISASIAERLAFAGLDVLYLVTDDQLDARRRLGISESDPDVARVQRGSGSVTIVGLAGAHAMDALYRSGQGRFGKFDAIIVDTPPVKNGGCLPGVLLIAPTDRDDASANLLRMLRATPANTDVVLVRIDVVPKHEWAHDAATIHGASNHAGGFSYLRGPFPRTDEVREALNCGQSVWTLPRRGSTREFIQGVESLAGVAWARIRPDTTLPPLAAAAASAVHIRGWDDCVDPVRARAEADAAERRGAGTLWAAGPVAWETVSAGTVAQPEVVPVVEDAGPLAPLVGRGRREPADLRRGGSEPKGRVRAGGPCAVP